MKVSPSLLAAPLDNLREAVSKLDPELTDFLHMDVMDGHFVPPITFGEQLCEAVAKHSSIPLDVHLMVASPEREVPKYFHLSPKMLTFHYETTAFPIRLLQRIQAEGVQAGISVNPVTPIEALKELFPYLNHVLVMTVEPGYYGQSFLESGLDRIRQLATLRREHSANFLIEVDGGVSDKNIQEIQEAGADIVVAGSYVFKAENPNDRIQILKAGNH